MYHLNDFFERYISQCDNQREYVKHLVSNCVNTAIVIYFNIP